MDTSASTRSRPSSRSSSRGSAAKVIVGTVALLVTFGIAAFASFGPVSADVTQPARPDYVWVGPPPKVSVSCGTLLDPHAASWSKGVRYVTPAAQRAADAACVGARDDARVMAIGSGSVGALLLALVLVSIWRGRRDA